MERKIEIKAEIDVRNRRGRHARGKKVTNVEYSSIEGQPRFLVTTCDSRIRLLQVSDSIIGLDSCLCEQYWRW